MRRALLLVFVLFLAMPGVAAAMSERVRLLDVSADVLPEGKSEFGLFWARYARGLSPKVQVSTHIAGDAVGFLNASAKYRFLDRDELRLSVEGGFVWGAILLAAAESGGPKPLLLFLPVELHATVPLADDLQLDLGIFYRASITRAAGQGLGISSLRSDLTLTRYDERGAWLLLLRFPMLSRADVKLDALLGQTNVAANIMLDDLGSFGALVGRDFTFGDRGHLRAGLGYRRTPGMVFIESLGHVLVSFDVYWR